MSVKRSRFMTLTTSVMWVPISIAELKRRTLAEFGECWGEDFVTAAAKPIRNALPAPAAMPSPMNQHECMRH
jgi:hypothetical protein